MERRSPLYDTYRDYPGVKLIEFAGWELPLSFEAGIIGEHLCVRRNAGLFDVSHMGEFDIEGRNAAALLDWLVTNRVNDMEVGKAIYSPMCYPDGGVVDDLLVYRMAKERFMVVVNAANTATDLAWISRENPWIESHTGVTVTDRTASVALMAFQGPKAAEYLRGIAGKVIDGLAPFEFMENVEMFGRRAMLSRTGYTGEDGFEIFARAEDAPAIWSGLMDRYRGSGVLPCGLGARDTLRIEARLPLYGQEISSEISPLEGGLKVFVKFEKSDFCGKRALVAMRERGVPRTLRGVRMIDKGVPRTGYPVFVRGEEVGVVTSGLKSPILDSFLGLVLVRSGVLEKGMTIEIDFGSKRKRAEVVSTPFYRNKGRKE